MVRLNRLVGQTGFNIIITIIVIISSRHSNSKFNNPKAKGLFHSCCWDIIFKEKKKSQVESLPKIMVCPGKPTWELSKLQNTCLRL